MTSDIHPFRQVPRPAAPASPTAPPAASADPPAGPDPGPRVHIGWIAAGAFPAGLLAALLLAAAPFIPALESHLTGAVSCGFALGWAMIAVLSGRAPAAPGLHRLRRSHRQ